jgi:hypothetical protein
VDNQGLEVQGGKGYVYTSPRGLAITLANGKPRRTKVKVTLTPAVLGMKVDPNSALFVEGEEPRSITPEGSGDTLSFSVALPAYGAGVMTAES